VEGAIAERLRPSVAVGLAALAFVPTAAAHITVAPTRVDPGERVRFQLFVPAERFNTETAAASLTVPAGAKLERAEGVAGWSLERTDRTITWSGGRLVTGQLQTFYFCARMPSTEGEVAFATRQRYTDGKVLSFPLQVLVAKGSGEPTGSCADGGGGLGTGTFLALAGGVFLLLAALLVALGRWLSRGTARGADN
jgi:uncharacterized protein YcnI